MPQVRTTFDPAVHGFHFANTFENHRFIGPVHISLGGRCGGMVYAALDFFLSGLPIPSDTTLPPEGSSLSTYISQRQDKSITNTLDLWIERFFNLGGARTAEFFHWGLPSQANGQFTRLKSSIDLNKPVPLGLFTPGDGGFVPHHQVLAIGYETGSSDEDLRIFVYNPNCPDVESVMRPDSTQVRYIETAPFAVHEWLNYFADLNYQPRTPNLIDPCDSATFRDWSGLDHSGRNYTQQTLRCSRFVGTNFTGATMMQTDLSRIDAEGANFYGANLRNSNFSDANLRRATFYGADLKQASLVAADASQSNFVGSDVQNASLERGVFDSADFQGANLANANLRGAILRNANFHGTDLRHTNLDNADFTGAIMHGADLGGSSRNGTIGLP